ncbi:MAG: hypothetical protein Q8908_01655, partial [Bacteroidota bacterium]|nr:hypothetical protein [Bacteroidota bacterium]
MLYTISGRAQSVPLDSAEVVKPSKYLLSAKGPSGEVILTTGRIVKAIAISRPQSMEIARIYLHYIAKVKLKTDVTGLSLATVSFSSMKLSGDLVYKGFNIKDYIFPSRVTFRLILPGSSKEAGKLKEVLVTVKAANVINGNCTVSVPLHKKISEIPAIDKLAFYHSDDDYERAESQMKLIDRYFTAGWLIQRS